MNGGVCLSVDLAFKRCCDIGIAVLRRNGGRSSCEFVCGQTLGLADPPAARELAGCLADLASRVGARVLLIDGPQAWRAPDNGLVHSRVCERRLGTPAKTGLPGEVKPRNYLPFVAFSIAVFDELAALGWARYSGPEAVLPARVAAESFPLSAWRALGIRALPAKSKTRPDDLTRCLEQLRNTCPVEIGQIPGHDELQALVSGLGGLALACGDESGFGIEGLPPFVLDEVWREGWIVNPRPLTVPRG